MRPELLTAGTISRLLVVLRQVDGCHGCLLHGGGDNADWIKVLEDAGDAISLPDEARWWREND